MTVPAKMLYIIFLTAFSVVTSDDSSRQAEYYKAAVYEHVRFGKFPQDAMPDVIRENLMAYERATSAAAREGADIIVFPEGGLHPETSREMYKEYAEQIPEPRVERWNPCESATDNLIARNLSCMAKNHNIYLVANMISKEPCFSCDPDCPDDKVYIYNTNVVFNRGGELVARYRKYHLFFEKGIDIPKHYEYVVFKTEFATIGTFICFDIMWNTSVELLKELNVDTVVYPLFWIDGLPIYSSIQTASSWAFVNNINLLAANAHRPSTGAVGSGIFLGASRTAHYVYEPNGKSKLIVAKVPIRGERRAVLSDEDIVEEFENSWDDNVSRNDSSGQCSEKILGPPKSDVDYRCMDLDLSNFTLVKLQKDNNTVRGCNNGLCCLASYEIVDTDEDYYLAVSNTTSYLSNYYAIWLETCMVIRCDDYNGTKCSTFPTRSNTIFTRLSIRANITSEHIYPSVLTSGMQLLPPEMWSSDHSSLSLRTSNGLLFATLNGRPYNRDPPNPKGRL